MGAGLSTERSRAVFHHIKEAVGRHAVLHVMSAAR